MRRFYSDQPLPDTGQITLEGQVVRHIVQVLRMQPGEQLELFDGQQSWLAELKEGNKNRASFKLLQPLSSQPASPLHTHLGQAISKGDKMDWIIQKTTELGISEITPLYTQLGDVRLKGEREDKKREHWRQVAISACEQCGRTDVPLIHPPASLQTWLAQRTEQQKLVLHPHLPHQHQPTLPARSVALLIGPEGGLAEAEVHASQQQGFSGLKLGPRILRTETAPIAALTLVQHWWGDL